MRHECATRLEHDFVQTRFADDVEVPARELSREAYVLAAAPNGERKLFVGNDELHRCRRLVDENFGNFGRANGTAHESSRFVVERNDVDFFAAQFLDDGLDALTTHPDASANRVDVCLTRINGDFRAHTGLSRHADELDDAFVDFGHDLFEQANDERRIGTAEHDLRIATAALHVLDIRFDAVALVIRFARRLLALGQYRLGAIQIDDNRTVFFLDSANDTRNELTFAIFVLLVDQVLLSLAHALQDDLLRRLRRDATKRHSRTLEVQKLAIILVLLLGTERIFGAIKDLNQQFVAQRNVAKTVIFGILKCHVAIRIIDALADAQNLKQFYFIVFRIVIRLDFALLSKDALGRRRDGDFERLDQNRLLHALFISNLLNDIAQFQIHELFSLDIDAATHYLCLPLCTYLNLSIQKRTSTIKNMRRRRNAYAPRAYANGKCAH